LILDSLNDFLYKLLKLLIFLALILAVVDYFYPNKFFNINNSSDDWLEKAGSYSHDFSVYVVNFFKKVYSEVISWLS